MEILTTSAPGGFGDREVRLHFFTEKKNKQGPVVLLLHGVHGWAFPVEGNKYGYLGRTLAANGVDVCLAESSRLRRDREAFGDDRTAWAKAAFQGKTFALEVYDACSAFAFVQDKYPSRPIVLWGFSLGGLLAVLLAGEETHRFVEETGLIPPLQEMPNGLIVSGSGDEIRPEAAASLDLPVLDTLGDKEIIHIAASKAVLPFALFFYGSMDETFSEESSRRIFDKLRLGEDEKIFSVVEGADHSFRKKAGMTSREPIDEMLAVTTATLKRYFRGRESMDREEV